MDPRPDRLELLATLALLVAARLLRPRPGESDEGLFDWALAAAVGFAAAFAAIFIALILSGSTPADLYDGAIVQGLKIGDVFVLALNSPVAALDWAVAALAAAVITVELRAEGRRVPSIWPGLLRVAAGLTIWLTVARSAPFSLGPTSNQEALPLVLAWVAVVSPGTARAALPTIRASRAGGAADRRGASGLPGGRQPGRIAAASFSPSARSALPMALACCGPGVRPRAGGGDALRHAGDGAPRRAGRPSWRLT